ncbi:MAG: lysophospholipid acyltransferase family protein [Thermoanaerobaculia bacterium]
MRALRERLAFLFGCLVGGTWFLLCSAVGVAWLLVSPGNRQTLYMYGRVFCRGLVRLMGWTIDVAGRERMDAARPCVFVANHQSFLDVVTFGSIFPPRTVSAGKREIGRIPVFGWFYRLSGNLVIDRDHPRGALASLQAAAETIREENLSVWFMPEGHRNTGPGLLPFKSGAFRLAGAAGVPIVPIVASPLSALADPSQWRARRGTLRVRVLEPVSIEGSGSEAETAARVRARMQEAVDELRGAPLSAAASL